MFERVLFSRLEWPSTPARKRAVEVIAGLIQEEGYDPEIVGAFREWFTERRLESLVTNALMVVLRIPNVTQHRSLRELIACVPFPSLLSELLLEEILGEAHVATPVSKSWQSGTAPSGFLPDSYFLKYKRGFVPPIYDIQADRIEERARIPFQKQWAFEWRQTCRRAGLGEEAPPHYFVRRSESEKGYVFDVPQSEAFRSAFLRTLAWAVDIGALERAAADYFAAESCPLDLGFWKIQPRGRPQWWPATPGEGQEVDTVAGEIWTAIDGLWTRFGAKGQQSVLAFAEGQVMNSGTAIYDLSIRGAFQKFSGGSEPEPEVVFESLKREKSIRSSERLLSAEGALESRGLSDSITPLEGWEVVPAVLRVESNASNRWSYGQLWRGIWVAASYMGLPGQHTLSVVDGRVTCTCDGSLRSVCEVWYDHYTELWYGDIPPPVGVATWIERDLVEEFCNVTEASLIWVVRLTCFHRRYEHGAFDVAHLFRLLGGSRILR